MSLDSVDHFDSKPSVTFISAVAERLCRDYSRGVCDRQRCKYKHKKPSTALADMNNGGGPAVLNFCHDYQNNSCPRPNCRFIHCTPAEEEQFKRTGDLPLHLQADAIRKHQLAYGSQPPVCKNFLNGDCRRGACKYRHITRVEHETEIRRALKLQGLAEMDPYERDPPEPLIPKNIVPEPITRQRIGFINGTGLRRNGSTYNSFGEYGPPDVKRRFFTANNVEFIDKNTFEISECDLEARVRMNNFFNGATQANQVISRLDPRVFLMEEENILLHKQIAELKKKVSDLTATNEFLLDQNAQLRVSGKRTSGNVTSVTVPAVTITNTTVPPINTSDPPPQQMIRTVTASVATVPVSIATVTAGSHPVSMVSMAPVQTVPAVSIAQPAAQQILAQSQQLLADPNSQLTLANNTTQLAAIAQQNLANNTTQLAAIAQQNLANNTTQLAAIAQQNLANNTTQLAAIAQQNLANNLAAAQQNQPQLTSQAQQLTLSTPQQLTNQAQQLALASTSQQLLAQQNLATSQQMALTGNTQLNGAITTSQAIAMSNATQPMVSYPIMTQSVLQNSLQPH